MKKIVEAMIHLQKFVNRLADVDRIIVSYYQFLWKLVTDWYVAYNAALELQPTRSIEYKYTKRYHWRSRNPPVKLLITITNA
jgi:hypothetical protein